MYFKGHFQNAYVTHDLDGALAGIDRQFGKVDWIVFEPDMQLKTPSGIKDSSVKAALGWHDGHQLEIIQPVRGYCDHYLPALPADKTDPTPRFHHIAMRRDDEKAMREEIARLGLPLEFEGEVPGLIFIYLNAARVLGHHIEFIWASPEGWEMQGWPKDRPVY